MIQRIPRQVKRPKYVEDGACLLCGDCCRYLSIIEPTPWSEKIAIYYETRGCVVDREQEKVMIPLQCPHLRKDNICDIYEQRPEICREFPRRNSLIFEHCGYNI
jgi:Fe-S-cluster containining protein